MEWTKETIALLRAFIGDKPPAFAERCGVSRQSVHEWEAGTRKPGGTARKLFDYIAADHGFTEAKRRAMAEKREET